LPLLFVARIGAGVAGATIATAQAFIADTTSEQERGKGMALVGAAFGAGFTFGPLLGSAWVSGEPGGGPTAAPGFVASGLSFIAFAFALFVLPESLRRDASSAEVEQKHWLNLSSLAAARRIPTIGLLIATFFVATFAFANYESTLALLTADERFGFSDRANFFLFAYIGFILSLAQGVLVRRLMPFVGEVAMANCGALMMAAGLACIGGSAISGSTVGLLGLMPLAIVGYSCLTPSLQSLISRRSPSTIQGEVLGVLQSAASLARILGPICGNLLFGVGLSHSAPYFFGAGVMGVAFLLSLAAGRARPSGSAVT
jgi:MFS family permease